MNQFVRTFVSFLPLLIFALGSQAQKNIIDEVIWVVGDDPILRSDVENQRIAAELEGVELQGNPYCVIPEQLAVQKLFLHQASLDSIEVTDADVLAELEYRLNYMIQMTGSKEKLEEYMHKPMSKIREQLIEQIRDKECVERVKDKLTNNIKVTPAEVRNYFKDLPQDSFPFIPTKYEVQIISLIPRVDRSEVERIEEELRGYAQRVSSGESDFSTLALLYSEDKESARQGGLLPYMGKAELVPEFANVAFSLSDPKKVSKIVKTEYGYHIMQFVGRQGDKISVRHILRKPMVSASAKKEALHGLDSLSSIIRNGTVTFEEAVFASEDKDTRNNNGLMINTGNEESAFSGLSSWFELKDLPSEVAREIQSLQEGEVSRAFSMTDKKGQEICAIVKLKSKNLRHNASVTEDFQTLQAQVLSQRKEKRINEWIQEKQKNIYVKIKEGWRNCDFRYPGWIQQ